MDYLSLLKLQQGNKTALVVDDKIYSYADLIAQAIDIRESIDKNSKEYKSKVVFIYEDNIKDQLVKFLAYSGTDIVPVIATKISKNQEFIIKDIPEKACMGVMTSGSTGKSKLLWRSYASWADFFPEQNKVFHINENSIIFCQGSLAFTGNLNIYLGVFATNGTIVASDNFRPKHWLDLIDTNKVNGMYLIPTKLLLLPRFTSEENPSIQTIISGSQSLGKEQADKLHKIYPNAQLTLYYGASELNYITYIKDVEMTNDRSIVGKPFKNIKISIEDEEIFIHTPYGIEDINMPFSLKDKGYIDELGNLHFLGRKDGICNVNGIKISSYKVEDIITKFMHVEEVAVISVHQNDTDSLVAFVVNEEHKTRQEYIKILKPYLGEFEIPKQFIYVDTLPKNESGKIDKLKLKDLV